MASNDNGLSYMEARRRRKALRNKGKPPRRSGPTRWWWFVAFFVVAFAIGCSLGVYARPIAKWGAKVYLSIKQGQWQGPKEQKTQAAQALSSISTDPNKSVNTLVMGSDFGSNKGETGYCRSDVMLLVCLQERDKKAVVLSIPRDTMITLPGHGTQKVNAAHAFGGPAGAIDAVKSLTGLDVNHYVSVNFDGFMRIVNALNGVPIHLATAISDPHAGYVPAGDQVLDGGHALAVVRSRKLPGGDVDRIKNQQAFLKALMTKLSNEKSVWKGKQLVDIFASTCNMDYTADQVTTLAEELRGFTVDNIQFVTIPGISKYTQGASYFIANAPQIATLAAEINATTQVSQATLASLQTDSNYQASVQAQIDPTADVVKVLSAATNTVNAVPVVASELKLFGHKDVTEGTAKGASKETIVYYRKEAQPTANDIMSQVPELQGARLLEDGDVTSKYNANVVVSLGSSFSTPGMVSIYGRLMQPAVKLENLGKKVKSFT